MSQKIIDGALTTGSFATTAATGTVDIGEALLARIYWTLDSKDDATELEFEIAVRPKNETVWSLLDVVSATDAGGVVTLEGDGVVKRTLTGIVDGDSRAFPPIAVSPDEDLRVRVRTSAGGATDATVTVVVGTGKGS